MDAQYADLSLFGRAKRVTNHLQVAFRSRNDVVGWEHAHHRVFVDGMQNMRGESDRRRSVALLRLGALMPVSSTLTRRLCPLRPVTKEAAFTIPSAAASSE